MRQITKDLLTDQSVPEEFRFSLRCGECGSAWHSIPIRFSKAGIRPETEGKRVIFRALYEREREQARLRAVEAAAQSFNRCPICGRLVEDCFPDNFADDDWYGGFADYAKECGTYLVLAENGTPVKASPWGGVVLAVVIALMIALVICLILKGKMKSVRKKAEANAYVASAGLKLTDRQDLYTHTTETRRKIESKSSSGSDSFRGDSGGHGRSGKF